MVELSLRQKSVLDLVKRVSAIKGIVKRWLYYAGMKFLQEHDNLTDEQELFLEEVTDFFVENIENIEHDKTFLKKIEMGPIDLSKRKKKVKV